MRAAHNTSMFSEWRNDYLVFVSAPQPITYVQATFIYTLSCDLRGRGCTQRLPGTGNLRSNTGTAECAQEASASFR